MNAKNPPAPPDTKPGAAYEVPVEGSLALLALGARGLEAWRAKRAEAAREQGAPEPAASKPDAPASDG